MREFRNYFLKDAFLYARKAIYNLVFSFGSSNCEGYSVKVAIKANNQKDNFLSYSCNISRSIKSLSNKLKLAKIILTFGLLGLSLLIIFTKSLIDY